ncbi:MAG: glycosyltransferase family 39 protein [Candidatus Kapabacteria bacterium]|jgi:4-amino-4-deoxy-L-arabinose transferase-like glycosyltransferase|nr:glycosyltransferase family 39 protein [Candidatus Kapabacteria bacterium]
MTWTKRDTIISLILACFAGFLFIPMLGTPHLFEGVEAQTAEISREMLLTGVFSQTQFDFQPSWNYPPVIHWLQALSMRLFGVNAFAVRFPSAFAGILTLPLLYALGKYLSSPQFGILWATCYAATFLASANHRTTVVFPFAQMFIILALWLLSTHYAPQRGKNLALRRVVGAGLCVGLAAISIGIVIIPLIATMWLGYWLLHRKTFDAPVTETAVFLACVLLISFLWFGGELLQQGVPFFREFTMLQIRQLTQNPISNDFINVHSHWKMLVFGCFPASALMFPAFRKQRADTAPLQTFKTWMLLLGGGLILLAIILPYKSHGFSIIVLPVSFFAAYSLLAILRQQVPISLGIKVLTVCIGGLWILALMSLPLLGLQMAWIQGFETILSAIQQSILPFPVRWWENVSWSVWEISIGAALGLVMLLILFFTVRKKPFEAVFTLLFGTTIVFFTVNTRFVPKYEEASQGMLVEFYQSHSNEECYIHTLGFQSALSLYYSNKQASASASAQNIPPEDFESWLLEADIDKPAYFVCKTHEAKQWRNHLRLVELYEKRGYVFFKRDVKARQNLALKQILR